MSVHCAKLWLSGMCHVLFCAIQRYSVQPVRLYRVSDRGGCLLLHISTGRFFACDSMPFMALFLKSTLIVRNHERNWNC